MIRLRSQEELLRDIRIAVDVVVEGPVDSAETEGAARDAGVLRSAATSDDVKEDGVEELHRIDDFLACAEGVCVLKACRVADLVIAHGHDEMVE